MAPAHDGFDTEWWRFVTKNGVVSREKYASSYRSWPARVWRGTGANLVGD